MTIQPVIMCGGPGARLWPVSTARRPKPFLALAGSRSLFQATVVRLAGVAGAVSPVIVTGAGQADEVKAQLAALGREGVILAEPEGRDSGPALLAALGWIARRDPSAIVIAVASDHHIPDDKAFAAAVAAASAAAEAGEIVTFGVAPTSASGAYGYIRPGEPVTGDARVRRVAIFEEKPDPNRARVLVDEGCLWNSGNFLARADAFLAEARAHAPEVLALVVEALDSAVAHDGVIRLGGAFSRAPKISIDVAVMEKTCRAAVLPIDYAWSDLGSWDAVWQASPRDEAGNVVSGLAVVEECAGCLIRAEPETEVVVLGGRGLVVAARGGQVLVADLSHLGALKPALERLADLRGKAERAAGGRAAALAGAKDRLRRWLWTDALPLWWCFGADHQSGGFHESLNLDLSPTGADRRARVQARQAFVYAEAGLAGWPGPWRAAMDHALRYLSERFERADGLFRASVRVDGTAAQETAYLYDQDFVLLAQATAARAAPDLADDLSRRARALANTVRTVFGLADGGFRAGEGTPAYLLDPVMHLFEAALAWIEVDADPFWRALADDIGVFFLERLLDPNLGSVREEFGADWRPAPGHAGQVLRPGHHFEWAWLLKRWASGRPRPEADIAAEALYAAATRGVDPHSGLVVDTLLADLTVDAASSRLWPQTERLKAAILLGKDTDALSAACALEGYFTTPIAGLWRDTPAFIAGVDPAPALASSFYHIVGAITALSPAAPAP